jgi:ABC-2 type transport system permease protein
MTTMNGRRFGALLQREWMQHQRGWWVVMAVPVIVLLLVAIYGDVNITLDADDDTSVIRTPSALLMAMGSLGGLAIGNLALSWFSSLVQASGLARRDLQDRSIEFWLSLPVGNAQSMGATLLTHLLLAPWLALLVGAAGGFVVSLVVVMKAWGIGAWLTLPWGGLALGLVAVLLRLAAGLVLATLWVAPLVLVVMAASAWLKRWGLPVVAAVIGVSGVVLDKFFDWPIVWDTLQIIGRSVLRSFFGNDRDGGPQLRHVADAEGATQILQALPSWAMEDLGGALQALLSPVFAIGLVVAGVAFMLLVLRRSRGA